MAYPRDWNDYSTAGGGFTQTVKQGTVTGTVTGLIGWDIYQKDTSSAYQFSLPQTLVGGNYILSAALCRNDTNSNSYLVAILNLSPGGNTVSTISVNAYTLAIDGAGWSYGSNNGSLNQWYLTVPSNSEYQVDISLIQLTYGKNM
jgi:hypothetical protein